jgi:hypothetical protein
MVSAVESSTEGTFVPHSYHMSLMDFVVSLPVVAEV